MSEDDIARMLDAIRAANPRMMDREFVGGPLDGQWRYVDDDAREVVLPRATGATWENPWGEIAPWFGQHIYRREGNRLVYQEAR